MRGCPHCFDRGLLCTQSHYLLLSLHTSHYTQALLLCITPSAEAILNSEVWDLRTYKLLRSVPALDGTQLVSSQTYIAHFAAAIARDALVNAGEEIERLSTPERKVI